MFPDDYSSASARFASEESPLSAGDSFDRGGSRRQGRVRDRGRQCRPEPGTHHRSHHARSQGGTAGRLRDARSADGGGDSDLQGVPREVPVGADRLGRILSFALYRCHAECKLRRFRGQGTGRGNFPELLAALRGDRRFAAIQGLSYKDVFGLHVHNRDAAAALTRRLSRPCRITAWGPWKSTCCRHFWDAAPRSTRRASAAPSAASSAAWCRCSTAGKRWRRRSARRRFWRTCSADYGVNAVQFYDNNFFLRESHAANWPSALRRCICAGGARGASISCWAIRTTRCARCGGRAATMIFFGVESGSDAVLREMKKQHHRRSRPWSSPRRIRQFDIVPEYSFVIGNPADPERETRETHRLHPHASRSINPDVEIIVQHYIPTPHPDGMYGEVEARSVSRNARRVGHASAGINFTVRSDPQLPWLPARGQAADRQFRDGDEFALAHDAGYAFAALGPDAAAIAEQLAIRTGRLRCSVGAASGRRSWSRCASRGWRASEMTSSVIVPVTEGYRLWSAGTTTGPTRCSHSKCGVPSQRLDTLQGLRVLDAGSGTGRWTAQAAACGAPCSASTRVARCS